MILGVPILKHFSVGMTLIIRLYVSGLPLEHSYCGGSNKKQPIHFSIEN